MNFLTRLKICTYVSKETYQAIRVSANKRGQSVAQWLRYAIEYRLGLPDVPE